MALQDTDLFVVERDDINYKLTFEELKTDIGAVDPGPEPGETTLEKPSVLTPPDGAGVGGEVDYFPETSAITDVVTVNNDYTSTASYTIINGVTDERGAVADVFDGNINNGLRTDVGNPGAGAGFNFILGQSITANTSIRIGTTSSAVSANIKIDGSVYTTVASGGGLVGFTDITSGITFPFSFDSFELLSTSNNNFVKLTAIEVDGVMLVDGLSTELTLTDANSYDEAGNDMGQSISQTFTAGQTVTGESTSGTYGADTAVYSTTVYNGTTETQIPTGVDNTGKSLVWIKNSETDNHLLYDTERGPGNFLSSNLTDKNTYSTNGLVSFDQDGFTLGASVMGTGGSKVVAWNFRAAPGFMDIVQYTGDSIPNRAVPHSLGNGNTPGMIIVKQTSTDGMDWHVWHKDANPAWTGGTTAGNTDGGNATGWLALNKANPFGTSRGAFTYVNDAAFGVYYTNLELNAPGSEYIAYLFADTPGKIKCGSYSGQLGGAISVDCGFTPGWVLIKSKTNATYWLIFDNKRGDAVLYPNETSAEKDESDFDLTFNSTGFTVNAGYNEISSDGNDYIYMAIAEDAMAGEFGPSGTLTADADASSKTISLTDVKGTWEAGMKVINDTEATKEAPGASNIVFTSSEPDTTEGTVTTWGAAEWELSTSSDFSTDLQEQSVSLTDSGVQTGPIFTLADGTDYYVRTKYNSTDPVEVSEVSDPNHFKTSGAAPATGGFSTTIYSGTGSTNNVATGINNTDKSLVWIKARGGSESHALFDTERGVTNSLKTNGTNAQGSSINSLTAFNSDGFTVVSAGTVNNGSLNYVAWNFKAGAGFMDIVSWDGDGNADRQIPHALSSEPGMIIVKRTNTSENWHVYHKSLGASRYLILDTDSRDSNASDVIWGDTTPTSTDFTVGSNGAVNGLGDKYISYLFGDTPGLIKCGTYTGNETDRIIETGFKPGWVMVKAATDSSDWQITDNKRGSEGQTRLSANTSAAEVNASGWYRLEDNGFYISNGPNPVGLNLPGVEYIYMAIAETVDGTSFFNTNTEEVIKGWQITDQYGITPDSPLTKRLGIAELTEQPTGAVQAFVQQNDKYQPIDDLSSALACAEMSAAEANERLDDANAALTELKTTLEARITALEADHMTLMNDNNNNGGY